MSIDWKRDMDGSWFATDRDGYFYRVQQTFLQDPANLSNIIRVWVCGWSETLPPSKLRLGSYGHLTADDAKAAMENIMASGEVAA